MSDLDMGIRRGGHDISRPASRYVAIPTWQAIFQNAQRDRRPVSPGNRPAPSDVDPWQPWVAFSAIIGIHWQP